MICSCRDIYRIFHKFFIFYHARSVEISNNSRKYADCPSISRVFLKESNNTYKHNRRIDSKALRYVSQARPTLNTKGADFS